MCFMIEKLRVPLVALAASTFFTGACSDKEQVVTPPSITTELGSVSTSTLIEVCRDDLIIVIDPQTMLVTDSNPPC